MKILQLSLMMHAHRKYAGRKVKKLFDNFNSIIDSLTSKFFFLKENKCYRKLKILLILPYAPYPVYTGGASRIYQKIKYFGARHHLVVASYFGPMRVKKELIKILKPYCKKTILVKREKPYMDFHTDLPIKVRNTTTRKMWKSLENLGDAFDIVMFEHINTAMYRKLFKSCFTIMEEHNIESRILEQYTDYNIIKAGDNISDNEYDIKQVDYLREFETHHWPLFNLRTTCSEIDRDLMQSRCDNEILVVRNGIDTDKIQPVEYQEDGKILYMGNMSYRPNIEAAIYFMNSIFPVLIKKKPGLTACIAGTNIPSHILEIAESLRIECIENPPDMCEVAVECSVSIVPLLMGSGTRIKILESLAMAIPVVSTTLGCEGLSVIDNEHLLIRDEPESFAEAIIKLQTDKQLRDTLRINGRRLVKQEYNLRKILKQYEAELLNRIFEKPGTVNA